MANAPVREEFPSNDYNPRNKEVEVTKSKQEIVAVVSGSKQKPSPTKRFFGDFLVEDVKSVSGYILLDVLLPATKNTISDIVSQGIDRLLFGDGRPRSGSSPRRSYTSYSSYSSRSSAHTDRALRDESRDRYRERDRRYDFEPVRVESRVDAERVIFELEERIQEYGVATVADYYQLVGITPEFTDEKRGWNTTRGAHVQRTRDGYVIEMPRPEAV